MDERALKRVTRLAHDALSGEVSPRAHAEGRARLLAALERKSPEKPARRALSFALLAAAAFVLLLLAVRLWPEAPLAYSIDGAPAGASYVQGGAQGAAARFGEGSAIDFAPGAQGRILEVSAHGARISLDDGSARFKVTHLPGARWTAEAGPFTVQVTGTEFDLTWEHRRLDLRMKSGAVTVRGPLAPQGLALVAGQHLTVDLARDALSLSNEPLPEASSDPRSPVAPAVESAAPRPSSQPKDAPSAPAPSAQPAPSHAASASPGAVDPPEGPSPRERVARGDFASVIAEAEAVGTDTWIDRSALADLAALADAARYTGRTELARRALLAERARFPGSAEARTASFLLGRIAEAASPAAAIPWYDLYLMEAPHGTLAEEAMGRKMVAVKAARGREAARPVAQEYLSRFPRGAFAQAASAILTDP